MSNVENLKTVIVFSTYRISPISEDFLFNSCSSERKHITGKTICDFFWNMIKADGINREDIFRRIWTSYLTKEGKNELWTKIEESERLCKNRLIHFIQSNDEIKGDFIDPTEVDFKKYPLYKAGKISQLFKEELKRYKEEAENHYIEVIKKQTGEWISEHIKQDGPQDSYNIKFPSNYNGSSNELKDKPLFSYRFSYYKLKESTDNIKVYAVWPLGTMANESEWIKALSEQFVGNANRLYLILHDKDIRNERTASPFEILPMDKFEECERFVALFQHNTTIGTFISKERGINEIWEFVENQIRNYHILLESSEILQNCNYEDLYNKCILLSDKYEEIKICAEELKNGSNNIEIKFRIRESIENAINEIMDIVY